MTDTSNTGQQSQPAGQHQGQSTGAPAPPSHEQLVALAPFQHQLTWVGSQEYVRGQQAGAKQIAEQLGMSVEEAIAKLKGQGTTATQGSGQQGQAGQQGQGQPNADLERRLTELEQRQTTLDQRETQLSERETAIKEQEQDGLRIAALEATGMTRDQAQVAKSMMQLPTGVTEMTTELAKASAEQLKTTFPGLFQAPAEGDQNGGNGNGQPQGQQAGGPPPNTHTAGTQGAASGTGGGVSAADRAKSRLQSRGHVKPPAS